MVDSAKPSRRGADPDAIRIVDPIDHLAPTIIKYEGPLQKLVRAGLEMSKHLQDELVKESCESYGAGLTETNETEGDGPDEPPEGAAALEDDTNDTNDHNLRDISP